MAVGTTAALGIMGGGALLGGIAGGMDKEQTTTRRLDPWTMDQLRGGITTINRQQRSLENIFAGKESPWQTYESDSDIMNFRKVVNQYLKSGGPSEQDISGAQRFTQDIFAPQQVAMRQAFEQQAQQNNRLATRLGRSADDPILAAKLAQEQTRQLQQLESQKTAFSAQNAEDRMGRQLSLSELLRNQALQNRQMIAGFGQTHASIGASVAGASGTASQVQVGNFGTALAGALGGAGAGASIASGFGGMSNAPSAAPAMSDSLYQPTMGSQFNQPVTKSYSLGGNYRY